ncbi:MAG: patatin [Frankiales bacterium]|nr:patatin [Frankiales bacterium]
MTRALVLAGGGVTGIAWETGVLLGLEESGRLPTFDAVIGTSAGSAVGAQLTSGTPLAELYGRQVAEEHGEITPELDLEPLIAFFTEMGDISGGVPPEQLVRVGTFAKQARTVPLADRRAVIEWRLPSHEWPSSPLLITTVDADTGELVLLDASSGVPLVDAVMASCAVPGVWPPVPLLGRLLIDGGVRSGTNLDLAADHDEVLLLAPLTQGPMKAIVEREAAARPGVTVVLADQSAEEAFGVNALDPSRRPFAAEAGRRQGLAALA